MAAADWCRRPASHRQRAVRCWLSGRLELDSGVGEGRGVAEIGEDERADRVDGGVAPGVLAPGSHRRHDYAGGDLVADPGPGGELAAVVEHPDVLPVGYAALGRVAGMHGYRLLALDATLGGL